MGVARLSKNFLTSIIAWTYVEVLRNTPLLLQIIFWYLGAFANLPRPKQSIEIFGFESLVLNNRGLYIPKPQPEDLFWLTALALVLAVLIAIALTENNWIIAIAIISGGILMIVAANKVAQFLQKNRMYEVLGLFILFLVGIMLVSDGGHQENLKIFGYAIN